MFFASDTVLCLMSHFLTTLYIHVFRVFANLRNLVQAHPYFFLSGTNFLMANSSLQLAAVETSTRPQAVATIAVTLAPTTRKSTRLASAAVVTTAATARLVMCSTKSWARVFCLLIVVSYYFFYNIIFSLNGRSFVIFKGKSNLFCKYKCKI